MHEFSIALNIVEIAEAHARDAKAKKVTEIAIDIGTQSGVVLEALNMALESAMKDTLLEGAHIVITDIQAEAKCLECNTYFQPNDFFTPCPTCGSFQIEMIRGKDLKVKSITIE